MEVVGAAIRGLLATRGSNVEDPDGRRDASTCFVCDALSGPGEVELSGEKVRFLVRALLVSGEDGGGGMPTGSYSAVRVCGRCNWSLGTLVDLYERLEDMELEFCGLRRRVGRDLILGKLKLSRENYAGWVKTVKSVEDVFPSKATGRLRKTISVALGTDEVLIGLEEDIGIEVIAAGTLETAADSAVVKEPSDVNLLKGNATSLTKPKNDVMLAERSCKDSSNSSEVRKERDRSKVTVVRSSLPQENLEERARGKKRPVESQDGSPEDSHPPTQKKSTVERFSALTKCSLVGRPRAGEAIREQVRYVESRNEVGSGDDSEDDDAMPSEVEAEVFDSSDEDISELNVRRDEEGDVCPSINHHLGGVLNQHTLINMPEFNELPCEVIEGIVSHCTSSAVLQLRLTSKRIKGIVEDSKTFKDVFQDVWIHLYSRTTLKGFLRDGPDFPFQNFRIEMGETATPHLFEDPKRLQKFVDRFSASILNLRVSHMYCGTVVGEIEFYESLANLQVLDIDWMEPLVEGDSRGLKVCPQRLPMSGPVGHSMQILEVQKEKDSGDFFTEWIRLCTALEVLKVPNEVGSTIHIGAEAFGRVQMLNRNSVYPYVLRLGSEGNLEHLKILDLNGVRMELGLCSGGDRRFFHDLLTRRNDFRLKNVSAAMLQEVRSVCVPPEWPWGTLELFKRKVVSMCGVHEMLMDDEGFPLLEELEFRAWNRSVLSFGWNFDLEGMRMPGLKKINARVGWAWGAPAQSFLDKLFLPEAPRETVVDLMFRCKPSAEGRIMTPAYLNGVFPNLTRVVLNLDGFDREERIQVIEVMSRKTFLEDLSLESLEGTPEEAFFGSHEDSPVLLRLTSLRKLSLQSIRWQCEVMGDRTLRLFARMSLTHLSIKGPGWETVTEDGVQAMLEGPFGVSVVSLKLDGLQRRDETLSAVWTELKGAAERNKAKWRLYSD